MGIKLRCPAGHGFSAEERSRGRFARCPTCSRAVLVPAASAGPSDPPGRPADKPAGLAARFKTAKVPDPPPSKPSPSKPAAAPPLAQRLQPSRTPARQKPKADPGAATTPAQAPLAQAPVAQLRNTAPAAPQSARRGSAPRDEITRWEGYQADGGWRGKVVVLAIQLILLAVFQALPTAPVFDLRAAPAWARVVLLLAALQIAYACWILLVPDWSTVWVTMLVLAAVAALYGTALGIAWVTPQGSLVPLGMPRARAQSQLWCAAVIVLTLALTYACGRVSHRWRATYGRGT